MQRPFCYSCWCRSSSDILPGAVGLLFWGWGQVTTCKVSCRDADMGSPRGPFIGVGGVWCRNACFCYFSPYCTLCRSDAEKCHIHACVCCVGLFVSVCRDGTCIVQAQRVTYFGAHVPVLFWTGLLQTAVAGSVY